MILAQQNSTASMPAATPYNHGAAALDDWHKLSVDDWLGRMNFDRKYYSDYVNLYATAVSKKVRVLRPTMRAMRGILVNLPASEWLELYQTIEFCGNRQPVDPDLKMPALAIAAVTDFSARARMLRYYYVKSTSKNLTGHQSLEYISKRNDWLDAVEQDHFQVSATLPKQFRSYFQMNAFVLANYRG